MIYSLFYSPAFYKSYGFTKNCRYTIIISAYLVPCTIKQIL